MLSSGYFRDDASRGFKYWKLNHVFIYKAFSLRHDAPHYRELFKNRDFIAFKAGKRFLYFTLENLQEIETTRFEFRKLLHNKNFGTRMEEILNT